MLYNKWLQKEKGICRDNPRCYVYFLRNATGFIKIGMANNPYDRMRQIASGLPEHYELLYIIPCDNKKTAFRIEHKLQDEFSDKRVDGEWFDINDILNHDYLSLSFSADEYDEETVKNIRNEGRNQIIVSYGGYTGPLFLSPHDAEAVIGLSENIICAACRNGTFPHFRSAGSENGHIYVNMVRFMKEFVCGDMKEGS